MSAIEPLPEQGAETDAEFAEVGFVLFIRQFDEFFGSFTLGARPQHHRRTVGIIRPGEVTFMALRPLETYPDVRLQVLDQMAHVNRAIRVWKGV